MPSGKDAGKRQNLKAKQLALLVGAISKCHNKLAAQALKGQSFDEEACENGAVTKFNAYTAKLTNCPACLAAAALPASGQATADGVDAALGDSYCASPSDASID